MKKILTLILLIVMILAFAACGAEDLVRELPQKGSEESTEGDASPKSDNGIGGDVGGIVYDGGGYSGIVAEIGGHGAVYERASGYVVDGGIPTVDGYVEGKGEDNQISAGQITAKAWNDNDAYEEWRALFVAGTENEPDGGKFSVYSDNDWAYDTSMRVKVTVTSGGDLVMGAEVEYIDAAQRKWISRTDVKGVAYLFPQEQEGSLTVRSGESTRTVSFSEEAQDLTVELETSQAQANVIKIMFVIDATGSMGDEMNYITAELTDVVHRVATQAEEVRIDLALLFYRDDGDREKFAYHDFVTVTDDEGLQAQLSVLAKQYATGGGDLPEAMDEAVLMGAEKEWGEENATRLMFLVLDAPSHQTAKNLERCKAAVKAAAAKGIRICPVLCSGADTFCEYQTRMGALLTGGTAVFVTDDSGIGGSHLDPDLPEATVEFLNDLLVRLIVGYHTGDFGTPVAWNEGQEGEEPIVTDPQEPEIVEPPIVEEGEKSA